MDQKRTHGGPRDNAGRNLLGSAPRRTLSISIDADTYAWLKDRAAQRRVPPGHIVDSMRRILEHEVV